MEKKKILWVSDLGIMTGFGRVSYSIIQRIKDEFDITGFGINYKGNPHNFGIDIFPASGGNGMDLLGFTRIRDFVLSGNYDAIFILQDVWVINQYLAQLQDIEDLPPIVVYFPVDAEEHSSFWYDHFDLVKKPVVYSKFGYKVANEASGIDFDIIPHGVDTSTFRKAFESREEAKKLVIGDNYKEIPEFIVLNGNRNQPRKRLDVTMRGFEIFARDKKNVALYMHCGVVDSSIHVAELAKRLDIDDKIIMTSLEQGPQKVSEEQLNYIYNACDVGINTSLGEGWGLVSVEHAATGAFQIVPNSSTCAELFEDTDAYLLDPVADYTLDSVMTVGKLVDKEEVAKALQYAYEHRNDDDFGKTQYEKFTSDEYDWKFISESWRSIFREVTG